MSEDDKTMIFVMLLFVVGLIGGCASGCGTGVGLVRKEAINRGYAQHNPKTGVFEWIEPKAKDAE